MLCPYRIFHQHVARRCHHHRVEHVGRQTMMTDALRNRFHDFSGAQHPALDRGGPQVLGQCIDLFRHERGGQRLPGGHAERVLRGDRSDRARSEDAELMERLQVRLNTRGASGIRSGDGQGYPHEWAQVIFGAHVTSTRGHIRSNLQSTVRDLQRRKARGRRGLAVLEGVRLVEEALAAGLELRGAVVTSDLARTTRGQALVVELASHAVPVEEVGARTFGQLAGTETPQGILAVVAPRVWTVADVSPAPGGAVLVVDGVQDPGNVGTLIRTAHALGAAATVLLRGSADPLNAKALRAAMGATFRHPVVPLDDAAFIAWAQRQGLTLWAAATDGVPLARALDTGRDADARKELIAVIVGNEGAGIRPQLNAVAAQRVAIPLAHGAESLNVAVAAGILLYEVLRGR